MSTALLLGNANKGAIIVKDVRGTKSKEFFSTARLDSKYSGSMINRKVELKTSVWGKGNKSTKLYLPSESFNDKEIPDILEAMLSLLFDQRGVVEEYAEVVEICREFLKAEDLADETSIIMGVDGRLREEEK